MVFGEPVVHLIFYDCQDPVMAFEERGKVAGWYDIGADGFQGSDCR
jgi:hypothetical protein